MNICITGASSGIGAALAYELARDGHSIWGVSRDPGSFADIKKKFPNGKFFFTAVDVSSREAVLNLSKEMKNSGFLPDSIFLCAGILRNDLEGGFRREISDITMGVNFFGVLNFVDVFLQDFLDRSKGQFVAMSSTTAIRPTNGGISYPASKAALSVAFKAFDYNYRPKGIIFSTVYVGLVATDLLGRHGGLFVSTPEKVAKSLKKVLMTKKSVYYMSSMVRILFCFPPIIGDSIFVKASNLIKKFSNKKNI